MKLDYATLISPYPFRISKVGSIKSPTLNEIWSPDVTYRGYSIYLSLLTVDAQTYCKELNPQLPDWFNSLSDEEQSKYNMFDLISKDESLQEQYKQLLDFFFVENVIWDGHNRVYVVYTEFDKNNQPIPLGIIHRGIWNELCDIILQRCGIESKNKPEKLKFKNKAAERIWKKTHKQESKENSGIELPNIVSAYAAFANGINITNIWNMTVFQVYDQFKRQRINNHFDISCMSVAVWGDKENKFDDEKWYETIYDN